MTVSRERRFTRANPCLICGGHDGMPRGKGTRCYGFHSSDGQYAHCTRDDKAGGLPLEPESQTYAHRLDGPCNCGVAHGPGAARGRPHREDRVVPRDYFARCPSPYPCDYTDEKGAVLYRVTRVRLPNGEKDYRYVHPDGSGWWLWGRGDGPRVNYRQPEVRAAIEAGEAIHVAEGEKCVHALLALGLCATTNDGGAEKWTADHTAGLRGAQRVVIWADNNSRGRRHAEQVPRALHEAGGPDVRVPTLPGLAEDEDIADWLERQQPDRSAGELRAELERLVEQTLPWKPAPAADADHAGERKSPWAAAQSAPDFLNAPETDVDFLVARLLARGSLMLWFSPRGLGKTHAAHALAVELARQGKRVLLIDRDNSTRELKRRLRGWGAGDLSSLKILGRDDAPPLTDQKAWAEFPIADYDLVVIDSIDASTEGTGEQDSAKPSLAIAPLLDIVHTAAGPAVLVLGNTVKSGSHGRGSGVIEDRADIVFEVRDATDLRPTGTKAWWLELPAADRGSWADRAARRKRRDTYRLAFVPTKFRIGEEPDPFVFEIRLNLNPWTFAEVTAEMLAAGEQAQEEVVREAKDRLERAAAALTAEVAARAAVGAPMSVRDDAEPFLTDLGLSRQAARKLIADRTGHAWRVTGTGRRRDPKVLLPPGGGDSDAQTAGIQNREQPHQMRVFDGPIPAAQEPYVRPETSPAESALGAAARDARFRPAAVIYREVPEGERVASDCEFEVGISGVAAAYGFEVLPKVAEGLEVGPKDVRALVERTLSEP